MLTLRHAADLLRAARSNDGRAALARALGFTDAALAVDDATAERLGLPVGTRDVFVARGRGSLRALSFKAPAGCSVRDALSQAAHGLAGSTSHVLWLLIAASGESGEVGIACWSAGQRGVRIVALVADSERVVASDAEGLSSLVAASAGDDLLVHGRWSDVLGREALSRRFYRALEQRVRGLADSLTSGTTDERHELALLCVSRLLFLSFLEAKGWLAGDRRFLSSRFDGATSEGRNFHESVLLPLFFGTLNTPIRQRSAKARGFGAIPFLNGGLFSKSVLERRLSSARFSNEAFGALFGELLDRYRFTAREGHDAWTEAAIDPEMLGRAFESLMASRERRMSGAFYTPQDMVAHLTERSLVVALAGGTLTEATIHSALAGADICEEQRAALRERLQRFAVLDPACGSGAFLVHVLERVADLHRATGDDRPLHAVRRDVAARCIHGVDINPVAVWLCELRLWLSVVIESEETRMSAVPPLPNLDCNIRVGDTLAGDAFDTSAPVFGAPAALQRLRDRYVRATGPRKVTLRRALDREERRRAIASLDRDLLSIAAARREALIARRSADLFGDRSIATTDERTAMRERRATAAAIRRERKRLAGGGALAFSFPSHFAAVHARGGFDLVIGNPPWVRLHNIPPGTRATLRAKYRVYREAAWDGGMPAGHTARGFASQVDLAALFVERSARLLERTGSLGLLLPSKLWRSLAGGGMRALLSGELTVRELADWSDAPSSFDAAVYPSVVIASRSESPASGLTGGIRRRAMALEWTQSASSIRLFSRDAASPWLVLPPDVRTAFDRIAARGIPLGRSDFGRAMLGVKCGLNDAFMVEVERTAAQVVDVRYRGRSGAIERELVRPLLRGDGVSPWSIAPQRDGIVWTHGTDGKALRALPSGAARWLGSWKRQLSNRSDLRGSMRWWTLFRTEAADCTMTRVVWSDFGRVPRAAVLPAGDPTVPLNSCYVVACPHETDALAFAALLNSALAAAWLNMIAEPARGGWKRYLGWTVSLLPIPADWDRARRVLAPLAERAVSGDVPGSEDLLDAACDAYRLRRSSIAPLLAWGHSSTGA